MTTLCSTEQENINGLGSPSEISMSGNFFMNPAQNALRDAYDNDSVYAFKVQFPSGRGFKFMAEVRQHTWSSGTNGVVAATFSLRLKGKPSLYVVPLDFVRNLPEAHVVTTGSLLTLSVAVSEVLRLTAIPGIKTVRLWLTRLQTRSIKPVRRRRILASTLVR